MKQSKKKINEQSDIPVVTISENIEKVKEKSPLKKYEEELTKIMGVDYNTLSRDEINVNIVKDFSIDNGNICEFCFTNSDGNMTKMLVYIVYNYDVSPADAFLNTQRIEVRDVYAYSNDSKRLFELIEQTKYRCWYYDELPTLTLSVNKIDNLVEPNKEVYPLSVTTLMGINLTEEEQLCFEIRKAIELEDYERYNGFSSYSLLDALEFRGIVYNYADYGGEAESPMNVFIKDFFEDNNIQNGDVVLFVFKNDVDETVKIKSLIRYFYHVETDSFSETTTKTLVSINLISKEEDKLRELLKRCVFPSWDNTEVSISGNLKLSIEKLSHIDIPEKYQQY